MYAAQLNTYSRVQQSTMTDQEFEASVLTKGAMMLKRCQDNWDDPGREKGLSEALAYNQKIWTIFQAALVQSDSPMPEMLKKNILSLSVLFDKQAFEVMSDPAPQKLTLLININLNIAAGLRGNR